MQVNLSPCLLPQEFFPLPTNMELKRRIFFTHIETSLKLEPMQRMAWSTSAQPKMEPCLNLELSRSKTSGQLCMPCACGKGLWRVMPRSLSELIEHADFYAKQFENYPTSSEDAIDSDIFKALWSAGQQKSALENSIAELVIKARLEDMSWKLIGQILGTSGEAARQRYGSLVKKKPKKSAWIKTGRHQKMPTSL